MKKILEFVFQVGIWPAGLLLVKLAENLAIARGNESWAYPFVIGALMIVSCYTIADTVTRIPKVRDLLTKLNNMGRRKK